ncbi:MAG TPA: HAMP domain-containing sensor histidine kinase [Thermoleophilaceae bacterium]|nr:HAMP domain-containing sensor histidine kinase [Thermoleophilaceae bacterium]
MSFRSRLTIYCSAAIALVLVVGSVATYVIERDKLRDGVDATLGRQSDLVFVSSSASAPAPQGKPGVFTQKLDSGGTAGQAAGGTVERGLEKLQVRVLGTPEFGGLRSFIEVVDARGKQSLPPEAQGGLNLPVPKQALEIARSGRGSYFTDLTVRGTHMRMNVRPQGKGHAVIVAQSLEEVDGALSRLAWSLGITGAIGILLAGLVGTLVARGALRPVRRMSHTAQTVAETRNLGERIPVDGKDELSRLAITFNAMLDSLDTAMRSQRQLVNDASHELRTPLTSLRTNIEVLRDYSQLEPEDRERLLRDLTRESEELSALVSDLVDLARGSQRDLHLREVELDRVADDVVERARTRFPQLSFDHDGEPTTVVGDPQELDRAIWNLVENAAKWSEAGGVVEVATARGEVLVRDHGPGIDPGDRPFVFDRFYRSQSARGRQGSGLGLAIVRQVAESHGGKVELVEAPGSGTAFRLSLIEASLLTNGVSTGCHIPE